MARTDLTNRRPRWRRTGRLLAALALLATGLSGPADAVEVIVAPDVPVATLSRNQARSLFTMRKTAWADGRPVRVFVLADEHPVHVAFCMEAMDIYPYQYRDAVERGIYTGVSQAPTLVTSEEEMKKLIATTPGAIGYVMSITRQDNVRPIQIR